MSETIQVNCVRLYILATLVALSLFVSTIVRADKNPRVQFTEIESVLDLYQGESRCVDILESKYGVGAVIVDGPATYSIENVCDFE